MAVFKYTVANSEGKKLSGTVEAPDEITARTELNNLGFSILTLVETKEIPKEPDNTTKYVFEAIDKNSKLVSGTIPSETEEEAQEKLVKEYALTITAIWKSGASEKDIQEARKKGQVDFQSQISTKQDLEETNKEKTLEQKNKENFVKDKIEKILSEINQLLASFEDELDLDQKSEINKKINKLLRIKHSTNTEYILATAQELLQFIESQESRLKEKGHQDKRLELQIQTRKLLDELNKTTKPESITEDILKRIGNWEKSHADEKDKAVVQLVQRFLNSVKDFFKTPPELQVIKDQIKVYNGQIFSFIKLYFKEPTPEYREKVKTSIETIWNARKKAKNSLKQAKKLLKERKQAEKDKTEEHFLRSLVEELNTFTGWLLFFYLLYYFVSIYLTTKDFGLGTIPQSFFIYESSLFKFVLGIIFFLHATTALKTNFFKRSIIANAFLIPFFVFGSIIVLLNF